MFDVGYRGAVKLTPVLDLVLAWNVGISIGWIQNAGPVAHIIRMLVKAVPLATPITASLMARGRFRPVPRSRSGETLNWACLTLPVAIVAGIAGLLYDPFSGYRPQKRPDPG